MTNTGPASKQLARDTEHVASITFFALKFLIDAFDFYIIALAKSCQLVSTS